MNHPMNELITDLKKPVRTAEDFVSATASAAGTAAHQAGSELSSALQHGMEISKSAWKQMEARAGIMNTSFHRNPYPVILGSLGAGTLLGILFTRWLACRTV
jgi:ElaB/YqjD/DUF883 family membrane-anchored ribosome-binding protein